MSGFRPNLNLSPFRLTTNFINKNFRDPVSSISHFIGAALSIMGLYLMLKKGLLIGNSHYIISALIFGLSLILLYTASGVYHMYNHAPEVIAILRRVDHMMIYVLIAGTYTPLCLLALSGWWGKGLLIAIWSLALIGIVLKLLFFNMPRIFSTLLYIIMGWLAIIALVPLSRVLGIKGMTLLLGGGLFYTTGGIIYALKWPHINSNIWGFHEIFHIFILLGSLCHFFMIYIFVF